MRASAPCSWRRSARAQPADFAGEAARPGGGDGSVLGERPARRAQRQRAHAARRSSDAVAVVAARLDARFGEKAAPRTLQDDRLALRRVAQQRDFAFEHVIQHLGALASAKEHRVRVDVEAARPHKQLAGEEAQLGERAGWQRIQFDSPLEAHCSARFLSSYSCLSISHRA